MSAWFGHGRLRLYLLKLLDDGPKHGYEVMRLMEDRTLGMYVPSAGTIYPRLQRLELDGLIVNTQEGGRKVYALTDAGRAELNRREGELAELEVELRENIFGMADEVRGEVRDSLRELKDELRQSARALKDERRKGRKSWQDWMNDWSSPTSPTSRTSPPTPVTRPEPSGTHDWPVGDFERHLQRFTEQVRQVAYRKPIDATHATAAAIVLDEALAKLRALLSGDGHG